MCTSIIYNINWGLSLLHTLQVGFVRLRKINNIRTLNPHQKSSLGDFLIE